MRQLHIGPPNKPFTTLDREGLQKIINRLDLVGDTSNFSDDMKPALANAVETLITQDLPPLLSYVAAAEGVDINNGS